MDKLRIVLFGCGAVQGLILTLKRGGGEIYGVIVLLPPTTTLTYSISSSNNELAVTPRLSSI